MALSSSHLSYSDCYSLMDEALRQPRGVRVSQPTHDAAIFFRMRLHQARSIDRKRSLDIYEPGDYLRNTSQYDALVVRLRPDPETNGFWVYLERSDVVVGKVEALPVDETIPALTETHMDRLPSPDAPLLISDKRRF